MWKKAFVLEQSTVTLFGGHSPLQINDHASRGAEQLALSLGWTMAGLWNHKNFPLFSDTVLLFARNMPKPFSKKAGRRMTCGSFFWKKSADLYANCGLG